MGPLIAFVSALSGLLAVFCTVLAANVGLGGTAVLAGVVLGAVSLGCAILAVFYW